MDADHVKNLVEEAVVEGLTTAVKQQPEDPVDFLGRFLVNYADHVERRHKAKAASEFLAIQAEKDKAEEAAKVAAQEAAASNAPSVLLAKAEDSVKSMLESAAEIDTNVLTQLTNAVKSLVGASACYIAELVGTPLPADAEPPSDGTIPATIKYLAVSDGQEFVKDAVVKDQTAPTFKSWIMPPAPEPTEEEEAPAEGEEGEEGAVAKPPPPPPELPMLVVDDVLREESLVFHGVPRPGAYVASPLQYGSTLHTEVVPADHVPVVGEDGVLALPAPVTKARSLAICVDTMGQNRTFTGDEVAALKRVSGYLRSAYERQETAAFQSEYALLWGPKGETAQAAEAEAAAAVEAAAKASEEEVSAGIAAAGGDACPEDTQTFIKASAALKAQRSALDARAAALTAFATRRIPPAEPALRIVQAVFFMLGATKQSLGDPGSPDPTAVAWPVVQPQLGADFVQKLQEFDATAPLAKPLSYHNPTAVRALLEGLEAGEVEKISPACPIFMALVRAALDVRESFAAKTKREKEEAEAKAKEEAEAAAAAAAAAAEAAAAEGEQAAEE